MHQYTAQKQIYKKYYKNTKIQGTKMTLNKAVSTSILCPPVSHYSVWSVINANNLTTLKHDD